MSRKRPLIMALALATTSASLLAVAAAQAPPAAAASTACPWVGSSAPIPTRVAEVMSKITQAQEIDLVTGASGSSYVGFTPAIGALCIPALNLQDGPAGVGDGLTGVTQNMVSNPNSILRAAIAGQHIQQTIVLHVTTNDTPVLGGGTANTAFLKGAAQGPNAVSVSVNATFWLETIAGNPVVHQLQYAQTVLLNFNGLSWPHITIATLRQ